MQVDPLHADSGDDEAQADHDDDAAAQDNDSEEDENPPDEEEAGDISSTLIHPRARGAGGLHARRALHRPRAGVASFFWPGRGRGRASSAAACQSLGGRTPISFTTALILSYR